MDIISPLTTHIPMLRSLWTEAFWDTEEFLDHFFKTAFHPDRCFCVTDAAAQDNSVLAALYWFRCEYLGKPVAYIYAVATAKEYRGQGICRKLLAHTHAHLEFLGYEGVLLVPGSKYLFDFYGSMGYKTSCFYKKEEYTLSEENLRPDFSLNPVSKEKYAALRRHFLPAGGVIQEKENMDFLETQCSFYKGNDFILAGYIEKQDNHVCTLHGTELLGNTAALPEILQTLACKNGVFRTPGGQTPFAMYKPLGNGNLTPPGYLGFAFD